MRQKTSGWQNTVRKVCKKRGKRSKKATPDRNIGLRTGTVGILLCGKTGMIKEFLDRKPLVSLFTRPRRFLKTLNMDMLRRFL